MKVSSTRGFAALVIALCLLGMGLRASAQTPPKYSVQEIVLPDAINNHQGGGAPLRNSRGDMVIRAYQNGGGPVAYLVLKTGEKIPLHEEGALENIRVTGLNDLGEVTGEGRYGEDQVVFKRDNQGNFQYFTLGLFPSAMQLEAGSIAEDGTCFFTVRDKKGIAQPYSFTKGKVAKVKGFAGYNAGALPMSKQGVSAFWYEPIADMVTVSGCILMDSAGNKLEIPFLSSLFGQSYHDVQVSDFSWAVGAVGRGSNAVGGTSAFVYGSRGMVELNAKPTIDLTWANGVCANGTVVGTARILNQMYVDSTKERAIIWVRKANGQYKQFELTPYLDLKKFKGFRATGAYSINTHGTIIVSLSNPTTNTGMYAMCTPK